MGVEPTGDGIARRPPVLKTVVVTGLHALPICLFTFTYIDYHRYLYCHLTASLDFSAWSHVITMGLFTRHQDHFTSDIGSRRRLQDNQSVCASRTCCAGRMTSTGPQHANRSKTSRGPSCKLSTQRMAPMPSKHRYRLETIGPTFICPSSQKTSNHQRSRVTPKFGNSS